MHRLGDLLISGELTVKLLHAEEGNNNPKLKNKIPGVRSCGNLEMRKIINNLGVFCIFLWELEGAA
jgi:hypothetical protein